MHGIAHSGRSPPTRWTPLPRLRCLQLLDGGAFGAQHGGSHTGHQALEVGGRECASPSLRPTPLPCMYYTAPVCCTSAGAGVAFGACRPNSPRTARRGRPRATGRGRPFRGLFGCGGRRGDVEAAAHPPHSAAAYHTLTAQRSGLTSGSRGAVGRGGAIPPAGPSRRRPDSSPAPRRPSVAARRWQPRRPAAWRLWWRLGASLLWCAGRWRRGGGGGCAGGGAVDGGRVVLGGRDQPPSSIPRHGASAGAATPHADAVATAAAAQAVGGRACGGGACPCAHWPWRWWRATDAARQWGKDVLATLRAGAAGCWEGVVRGGGGVEGWEGGAGRGWRAMEGG